MAEHIIIINNLVKNPPTEKFLTKIIPKRRAAPNITAPHIRPDFMPCLPRRFAAVKPPAKQPAQRAKLDISAKAPSLRSITEATAENTVHIRNIAPKKARAVWSTRNIL